MKHVFAKLEKSGTTAPLLFDLYTRCYRGVVGREIELAGVDRRDTVLNVGCGAMPFTAVLVAKLADADVYALDNDDSVPERARRNVAYANVADRVQIVTGDGRAADDAPLPHETVTTAFVAVQATPKAEIVDHLRALEDGPDRIVVRHPRGAVADEYGALPPAYEPVDAVSHPMPTFGKSLLFERR
ncbi:class I SAM-dependent methyltransferase [Natrarchaeobaculum sulfurireducens]|uniref:Protein-L-isoaspartate carboxylmethyltransferase n=1 Tax=Natrarchaeobaculum sulfurireducens TaxID=2044521 RepID=A0A346PLT9_9EURY|nr:class I SAM-dependent methyltransferase [Natrarchaeobaculum sulfurireducens]AXR76814.1 Protein-L-isoaspartate carboxylmethyltransferase [Natrarchaeobaculum sulfurireducens]AXR80484.1 hypothetical protein AArcMg_0461 [Natrarchaeobaculum sulfurireducens]